MQESQRNESPRRRTPTNRKYTQEKLEEIAYDLEQWLKKVIKERGNFFWSYWSQHSGYSPECASRWSKQSEVFKEVYDQVKDYQKHRVIEGTLEQKYSAKFAPFYLKTNWPEEFSELSDADKEKSTTYVINHYGDKDPKTWEEIQKESKSVK